MKILLKIRFDGTMFCGYQTQPSKRTVQSTLNEAANHVFGRECNITGCSRTDSGVHALCFYCTVCPIDNTSVKIPIDKIPNAFNCVLSNDISVLSAFWVNDDFHPRYDVISKEYTYLIHNSNIKDPFLSNRALQLKHKITDEGLKRMNDAAAFLCGTHDFKSFMAQNSKITDSVRTIFSSSFEKDDDLIRFKISGNGFLYNMVRIIVGTLIDVGYGKKDVESIKKIIESCDRKNAGQTVQPHGLYLSSVIYDEAFNIN